MSVVLLMMHRANQTISLEAELLLLRICCLTSTSELLITSISSPPGFYYINYSCILALIYSVFLSTSLFPIVWKCVQISCNFPRASS